MTDRSVVYRLRAEVGQFRAQMAQAGSSVKDAADKMTAATREGETFRRGLSTLGDTSGKVAIALGAAFATSVVKAANFEQAMSHVRAATHESAQSMERLRRAALDAGSDTAFSATESAAAIEELAKAGISTEQILSGGLQGALDLAAAGGLDVAAAAEAAASAMTQFKLSGEDVPHIADLLAAGAGKAQGSVQDMSMALNQSGLIAAQTGLTIEETTGALSAFASAGLTGSDAGTSFKTMLQSLTPTSKQAKELMEKLGISAYDSQGNFVGLTKFADSLRKGLKNLSTEQQNAALKTIFGSDAVRAAAVLYEQGGKGIQSWIDKTNDSGYAAETAAIRMDNLKGDLEELGGALETAFIGGGSGQTGFLRDLTQEATDLINAFNDLPKPVQEATVSLAGLGAVGAGGFWLTSKVVTSVADTRQAFSDLGLSFSDAEGKATKLGVATRGLAGAAGLGLLIHGATQADGALGTLETAAGGALTGFAVGGPWGLAIGAGAGALIGLATSTERVATMTEQSRTSWESYRDTLDQVTGAVTRATRSMVIQDLQQSDLLQQASSIGINKQTLVDGILGEKDARESLAVAIERERENLKAEGEAWSEEAERTGERDKAKEKELLRRWDIVEAIEAETGEVIKANEARIEELALINKLPPEVITRFQNNAPETARDVAKLAREYDLTPEQVKTVVEMMGDRVSIQRVRAVIRELEKADKTKASPSISVDTRSALAAIRTLKGELAGLGNPRIHVPSGGGLDDLLGADPQRRADGGLIRGPGGPRDDAIPALLSNREYVVQASAVAEYGVGFFDALNDQKLDIVRRAGGGATSRDMYALASGGAVGDWMEHAK